MPMSPETPVIVCYFAQVRARALAKRFGYVPTPDLPESMNKLAETVDLLLTKEDNMVDRIEEQKSAVRKHLQANDKRKAGAALKRLRLIEISLNKTTSMRIGVEAHRDNMSEANVNMDVAEALSSSAKAMRATFGASSKEASGLVSIEKLVDDMAESMQDCSEISQLLSEPLQVGMEELEEFDIEKELSEFAQTEGLETDVVKAMPVHNTPVLPSVPTDARVVTPKQPTRDATLS